MKIVTINKNYNYNKKIKVSKTKKYITIVGSLLIGSALTGASIKQKETIQTEPYMKRPLAYQENFYNPNFTRHRFGITDLDVKPNKVVEDNKAIKIIESTEEKKEKKLVALTFDDGPGKHTQRLLDILKQYDIKVTFFLLGSNISKYEDVIKNAYNDGHELAIHGFSHNSFTKMTIDEVETEIVDTKNLLLNLDVTPTNYVRPPYGNINEEIEENLDYSFILWSVDTEDWKSRDKYIINEEVNKYIEEGSIILMHDIHSTTVDAVEYMLPSLIEEYEFVTVSELFNRNNQILEENEIYKKVKILEKVEE